MNYMMLFTYKEKAAIKHINTEVLPPSSTNLAMDYTHS